MRPQFMVWIRRAAWVHLSPMYWLPCSPGQGRGFQSPEAEGATAPTTTAVFEGLCFQGAPMRTANGKWKEQFVFLKAYVTVGTGTGISYPVIMDNMVLRYVHMSLVFESRKSSRKATELEKKYSWQNGRRTIVPNNELRARQGGKTHPCQVFGITK